MTDIPEDVMKEAEALRDKIWAALHDDEGRLTDSDPAEIIAKAILAERERAAKAACDFRLAPASPEERKALSAIPPDIAETAKQAAWLGALNAGVTVSWYSYAEVIIAERERHRLLNLNPT